MRRGETAEDTYGGSSLSFPLSNIKSCSDPVDVIDMAKNTAKSMFCKVVEIPASEVQFTILKAPKIRGLEHENTGVDPHLESSQVILANAKSVYGVLYTS